MRELQGFIRRHVAWLAPLSVLGVIGFSIACGAIGVDFGWHWDEHYHISGVRECVDGLALLPRRYIYGNMYFLLGLLVVLAHNVRFLPTFVAEMLRKNDGAILDLSDYHSVKRFQESAHTLLDSKPYLLQTRMVFFVVSSLAAIWIYLTVRKLHPGRYVGAIGAAAFVALSWELHYHQRFIAVDAVVAQFMAAELYFLTGAWYSTRPTSFLGYYAGAAVVAGVLFTCKATGLVAVLPVLLLPLLRPPRIDLRLRRVAFAALAGLVSVTTVLVLQPGTAIDFFRYATTLRREAWEYSLLNLDNYNVIPSVVDRIRAFFTWLCLAVPSPYVVGSVCLSAVVVVGIACFVRDRRGLSILGAVVVVVLLAMVGSHPLFFVRQYLMFIPFTAVGFGVGLNALEERFGVQSPWIWRSALIVTTAIFALNAHWLHATASGIRKGSPEGGQRALIADLLSHPHPVRLSPSVLSAVSQPISARYRCHEPTSSDLGAPLPVVIRWSDAFWRTNRLGLSRRFYGPRWINRDWYPPGGGIEPFPIFVLSPREIAQQQIAIDRFGICEPLPAK